MKFGVRVPKDVNEARKLDAGNGNTLWQDAILKEYDNVKLALASYLMMVLFLDTKKSLATASLMSNLTSPGRLDMLLVDI